MARIKSNVGFDHDQRADVMITNVEFRDARDTSRSEIYKPIILLHFAVVVDSFQSIFPSSNPVYLDASIVSRRKRNEMRKK